MALFFEEIEVGRSYLTRGRTIGEGDIMNFAGLVGDYTPLHVDEHYSRQTQYGGRIAHGPLTLAVAIGMMTQLGLIDENVLGLLNLNWDFSGPVKIGDTIHARVTIAEARPTSKRVTGIVKFRFEVINHREEMVQDGHMTIMVKTRAGETGAS